MSIMVLMMTITALGWRGIRRGAEMRGAAGTVRTGLMLARQQAILKRQNIMVLFRDDGTNSFMETHVYGLNETGATHSTLSLTPGVAFDLPMNTTTSVVFRPGGGSYDVGTFLVTLRERYSTSAPAITLTNWMLTGITE